MTEIQENQPISAESREDYDLLVIGAGINGAGVARDAAGRGYKVLIIDKGDVASATSGWSTKLIHGGLRYLEHNEFGLVSASLKERARLLSLASHLVHPLRFVLPHDSAMRPAWLIRVGLFLYDHLSMSRKVPASTGIDLSSDPAGQVLKPARRGRGFTYYDAQVDDVRLTINTLKDAEIRGAEVRLHTEMAEAEAREGLWTITLKDRSGSRTATARHVVNAAGPWADKVAHRLTGGNSPIGLRLVRGSHLVIPRPKGLNDAYLMQQPDERVVFIIPYEHDYALIGTTDADHINPDSVAISDEEVSYLLGAANSYLDTLISPNDIVWTFAGVRPLLDDGTGAAQEVTRDYKILTKKHFGAGVTHIFGGKLTTFRTLSQKTVDEVAHLTAPASTGLDKDWTDYTPFVDAFIDDEARRTLIDGLTARLAEALSADVAGREAERLVELYGRSAEGIGRAIAKAGVPPLACGLFAEEVAHFVDQEWAETAEDILFRRTKRGIGLDDTAITELEKAMAAHTAGPLRQMA